MFTFFEMTIKIVTFDESVNMPSPLLWSELDIVVQMSANARVALTFIVDIHIQNLKRIVNYKKDVHILMTFMIN